MKENIEINEHFDLYRLKKFLNYEISFTLLYVLSFQVFPLLFLASFAAIIFTPFMLKVLYEEEKKNWIILFILSVLFPLIIILIIGFYNQTARPLIVIILVLFYFYCFLLRLKVNSWIHAIKSKNMYILEKQKRDLELKQFTEQFNINEDNNL